MMFTLVVEFGRQRRKFELRHPIDLNSLENQIKSSFGIDEATNGEYLIQIFDEQVHEYLDLTCDSFVSTNNNVIKGQIILRRMDSFPFQPKVSKQQVVGLITLESIQSSLQQWSQLLQHIQVEIGKELQGVKETISAVKSHYQLIDDLHIDTHSPHFPSVSNCSSPSVVSQRVNNNPSSPARNNSQHLIRPIPKTESNGTSVQQQIYRTNGHYPNRRGTFHSTKPSTIRENSYNPPRPMDYNYPVTVTYQRFQSGVDFEGELSKYYNPTYFFLRISNQTESYDEMHQNINLYYNNVDVNKTYLPQPGDFCVAKSLNDSKWYRARLIRLVGNERAQLIFIDTGEIGELSVGLIQPLNSQFTDRPAQALACSLAQVLPFTQSEKSGWNRRACMSLENSLKAEQLRSAKVTVADMNQVKWPMMFIHISTPTIANLTDHMCDLYLSRRASNMDISDYWSMKIRPEQYVLFNLPSLANQKQYFVFNTNRHSSLSFDQTIDLVIGDLEFFTRQ